MARKLDILPEDIDGIVEEFRRAVKSKAKGGSISFSKNLGTVDEKATVYITEDVYLKEAELVKCFGSEIGWYGCAQRVSDSGIKGAEKFPPNSYFIYDILVPPQVVSDAKVDTLDSEMTEWLDSLPDDVFNNLRYHGHSHVNMPVGPSPTDKDFQNDTSRSGPKDMFYIFSIHNKSRQFNIWIYDRKTNIFFETSDITIQVVEGEVKKFVREAASKLREAPVTRSFGTYTGQRDTHTGNFSGGPIKKGNGKSSRKTSWAVSDKQTRFAVVQYDDMYNVVDCFYVWGTSTIYNILDAIGVTPLQVYVQVDGDEHSVKDFNRYLNELCGVYKKKKNSKPDDEPYAIEIFPKTICGEKQTDGTVVDAEPEDDYVDETGVAWPYAM